MTHRNQHRATLATLGLAAAAVLAVPSVATAHHLTADCTTVNAAEFPEGANTATIDTLVNGVPAGQATYSWTVPPPAPPFPVPYGSTTPYAGDLVQVYGSFTSDYDGPRVLLYTSSACGPVRPAVAPPSTPPPTTPVPVSPPRIQGCADLPAGAGMAWRVKFGCVVPRRPARSCAYLRAHHAGLRWLIARGCALPKRPPFEPPVAG